ncbi:hypothetical protein [Olivibacter sitiensis]|uniref:hypothetical protein n=1 Tax=Olivibacter sitiensis TaxID=376470 RepID=UPI000482275F|nr:hypothetical protein [Olivibacter sitiensis]
METLKFRTDFYSSESLGELLKIMNTINGIVEWKIDFDSIYKLLIVKGKNLNAFGIKKAIEGVGHSAVRMYEE